MKLIMGAVLCLALCACASTQSDIKKDPHVSDHGGRLSERSLPPGTCGLFVWSADAKKRLLLFSRADAETPYAIWFNGREEQPLTLGAMSGISTNGQYPVQSYQTSAGANLHLSLMSPESIEDGTAYKRGTLKSVLEGDFKRVMPVVGLSVCQS